MNGTPARRPKTAFSESGVRIKEVSEGRPCDNCPELCPGFIPHAWRLPLSSDREHRQVVRAVRPARPIAAMCLSLKQLELAEVYRRVTGNEKEPQITERKIQKFPSRERNYAVRRRKTNNNNVRSHANCPSCARITQEENR